MRDLAPIAASIVVPTRSRPAYLEVALASIAPQARAAGAEVVVVDDAEASAAARAQAERLGARYETTHREPSENSGTPPQRPGADDLAGYRVNTEGERGLNAARNMGVERSRGELVVFVDDDVRAAQGWLGALLGAAREHGEVEVFAGRIRACLEGRAPRTCGREAPPITTLDLGERDIATGYAWGANMAIRRRALERVGGFDTALVDGGDEQEWQDRLRASKPGSRTLYVAGALVEHRRAGEDARLRALARTAYVRGRAARRFDVRAGQAPRPSAELITLAGCGWHVVRRVCPAGLTMVAHSAGRVREALRPSPTPQDEALHPGLTPQGEAHRPSPTPQGETHRPSPTPRGAAPALPKTMSPPPTTPASRTAAGGRAPDDFLSGASGTVGGLDARLRGVRDGALDAWEIASARRLRLVRAARREPPRRSVLALGVVRPEHVGLAAEIRAELLRSRHAVELYTCAPGGRGKFENINRLLDEHSPERHDWLVAIDDDIVLPRGFLDRFVFLCERFDLRLAQPAHRLRSHAAWAVTRRRAGSVVRETELVEIGPVTAFARATFATLLPFPELRMGWGLDAHWAALARAHGWRRGVVDAVAITHRAAPAADAYSRERAVAEAREFLAQRPYVRAGELGRTLTTHHRW